MAIWAIAIVAKGPSVLVAFGTGNVPLHWSLPFRATYRFAGAITNKLADPVIEPDSALIVAGPVAIAVARPALLMVAKSVGEELQATELVTFCVLPSV